MSVWGLLCLCTTVHGMGSNIDILAQTASKETIYHFHQQQQQQQQQQQNLIQCQHLSSKIDIGQQETNGLSM